MPKKLFWPLTLVVMGLILLASNMGLLPAIFWNFWPLMLIIVGLAGILISDRDDWNKPKKTVKKKKSSSKKSSKKRKTSKKK